MTDAFSYALYFACGKTSGSKATRDYRPRSATFLGLQRMFNHQKNRVDALCSNRRITSAQVASITQDVLTENTKSIINDPLLVKRWARLRHPEENAPLSVKSPPKEPLVAPAKSVPTVEPKKTAEPQKSREAAPKKLPFYERIHDYIQTKLRAIIKKNFIEILKGFTLSTDKKSSNDRASSEPKYTQRELKRKFTEHTTRTDNTPDRPDTSPRPGPR